MKRLWTSGLGLVLGGIVISVAWAQSPAQPASPLKVSLGAPVVIEPEAPVHVDPTFTRVSFHHQVASLDKPETFQASAIGSRPMPVGPAEESNFAAGKTAKPAPTNGFAERAPSPLSGNSGFAASSTSRVIASSAPLHHGGVDECNDAGCGAGCGDCCDTHCKKHWGCGICDNCCPLDPHKFYFSAEYLMWWIKAGRTPPLVTTSPFTAGDPLNSSGILGRPGTTVLFDDVDHDVFSGGRFTLGWWTDPCCQSCGFEISGFFLGERNAGFFADSSTFPVLARPFFNGNGLPPLPPGQFSEITARPDLSSGSISIDAPSELWGIEANVRCNVCCACNGRWDLLVGARYLDLKEGITIVENVVVTSDDLAFPAGTQILVVDDFRTRNQFYGGQIGLATQYRWNRWSLDVRGKIALGFTHQTADIFGGQVIQQPGGVRQSFNGGLLALPGNIGHHSRDMFTIVPEVGVNLGYDLTHNLRCFVGYTFLYWNNVLRPGDQIDPVLNINRIPNFATSPNPGPNRPIMPFKGTDFWAQGVSFGLEYRY